MSPKRQRGAALLVTLTLVSILTIIASELYKMTRDNSNRLASVQDLEQAQWYALSGEQHSYILAKELIEKPAVHSAVPVQFPIAQGNMTIQLNPVHNCFNINSLDSHKTNKEQRVPNPERPFAIKALQQLLISHNIDSLTAKSFTSRAADWIDADSDPIDAQGLERSSPTTPLPVNGHLQNINELKQLDILSDEQFSNISELLCARTGDTRLAINPNDLEEKHATLISALSHGVLDSADAKQIIQSKPADGYSDINSFIQSLQTDGKNLPTEINQAFHLERNYFKTRIQVMYERSRVELNAYFSTDGEKAQTLSRYYGVMP
ncbi:type II secretion system minor pseudopilin GspK [Neptuniibacter sp. QD72_48]|uniref:type II secretion system minor pseudopilin GspK n=1 Tax=unclassified Neptuniibacter TaxID=2630693 RepID=UPI0039F5ABFB